MAMMDSTAWSSQDQAMHAGPDDDFQQFLDMNTMGPLPEGLQFDFQDFQGPDGGHVLNGGARDNMDTTMSGTEQPVILSRTDPSVHGQMTPITSAPSHPVIPTTMMPPPTPTDAISEIDAQIQYLQQQRMQQQQRQLEEQQAAYFVQQSQMVPPTPQSLELAAGSSSQFYGASTDQAQQQQQALYDRYHRLKEQQELAFTPLVSPAVTPLESHFPIDAQFTIPGAYFSPLTSPALHAQNDPVPGYDHRLGRASTSSPGEMDLEPGAPSAAGSSTTTSKDLAKKVRKSNAVKTRGKANIRQSPISKPQRRKTGSTPILNAQVLTELAEDVGSNQEQARLAAAGQTSAPQPNSLTPATSAVEATDSENASVSPETLSDMPPPPVPNKPRSARPSPNLQAKKTQAAAPASYQPAPGKPSPATPASLMRLASPSQSNLDATAGAPEPIAVEQIESFELPESASFPKSQPLQALTPVMVPAAVQSPSEPGSSKTSFRPLPSPVFAKPTVAASQSPQLAPGSSSVRKTPQLAPKGSKKRSSVGSVQVSPALRPRISPNIKPLLPGGATAEDTASQLLASKSNYQNILEGNKVPGVSYPSELSTNLTSKRTSHKIAEQGRRNRINSALLEIATLLPPAPASAQDSRSSDGEGDGGGGSAEQKDGKSSSGASGSSLPSSKASTVEMAIGYIKQLRQEVAEATRRAELAEKKLEDLS